MADLMIVLVIVAIISIALYYIKKEKKRGIKCIGCPFAQQCSHNQAKNCTHNKGDNE